MEISENDLVKRLRRFQRGAPGIVRGIGDDCAVIDLAGGRHVFTQDAMVEHVHFEFAYVPPRLLGRKAVLVNVSDVLSMGAEPLYFLVTTGVPAGISYRTIRSIYRGMAEAGREFGATLIGGDTVSTQGPFFIDISMTGRLATERYFGRDSAKVGDIIAVTGRLGESALGLELLAAGKSPRGSRGLIDRYRAPRLPYAEWRELVKRGIPNAMMDISDGLVIDLERMMRESGAGAVIDVEDLPVPDLLRHPGGLTLALSGGEDYQLLFTFSPEREAEVRQLILQGFDMSLIGRVTKQKGVRVREAGSLLRVAGKGYDHFGRDQ